MNAQTEFRTSTGRDKKTCTLFYITDAVERIFVSNAYLAHCRQYKLRMQNSESFKDRPTNNPIRYDIGKAWVAGLTFGDVPLHYSFINVPSVLPV